MLRLQRGDLLDLDAGAEFDLVAGDGRAAGAAGDRGVDLELLQHLGDGLAMRSLADVRRFGGSPAFSRSSDGSVYGPSTTRSNDIACFLAGFLRALAGAAPERSEPRRRAGSSPSVCRLATPAARHRRRPTDRRNSRRRSPRAPRCYAPARRTRRRTPHRGTRARRTSAARSTAPRGSSCRSPAAGRTARR